MRHRLCLLIVFLMIAAPCAPAWASGPLVRDEPDARTFPLVAGGAAVDIVVDPADFTVVQIAARDLAGDIERVTGIRPAIKSPGDALSKNAVLIGTVDHSAALAGIPHKDWVRNRWETYMIAVEDAPLPGVETALIIAGSDRRGAAFGAYELSREIGVSPWSWWADAAPDHRDELHVRRVSRTYGPPSVKYRGIFINDEKFGLHPWAANTFEPENNGIGPRTYQKVFELLLRLRGNYIWPAMKQCTRAFNSFDENRKLAHDYAIVMGSSHCEHLLRNNIDEWPRDGKGAWDYTTNRGNILAYWAARLETNGQYENIYTLGMRGADDKEMPGGGTLDEQTERLGQIIRDQRDLLAKYVDPDITKVPQILSPYKEVLDLYRNGLDLPDDVTILWTDDNYGYIRKLPNEDERKRPGGNGVYYHISYSGNPHDYLWLNTTPPALMWYELQKAYDHGARTVWVLNVGDIKPMESGIDVFMNMSWNVDAWDSGIFEAPREIMLPTQFWTMFPRSFLRALWNSEASYYWDIPDMYMGLAARRKPELMGYNERDFPNTKIQDPDFSLWHYGDEVQSRINAYIALEARAADMYAAVPDQIKPAFYELVLYPVRGASLMNQKVLYAYKSREYAKFGRVGANRYAALSRQAFEKIKAETEYYNKTLAAGKWDGIMDWRHHDRLVFHEIETGTVKPKPGADFMVMIEGQDRPTPPVGVSADNPRNVLPELNCIKEFVLHGNEHTDLYNDNSEFIDLFNRGSDPIDWTLESGAEWITLDQKSGSFADEQRIHVSAECKRAPVGQSRATLTISGAGRTYEITVPVFRAADMPDPDSFVQKNMVVAIPASRFMEQDPAKLPAWKTVTGLGRTTQAIAVFPTTMPPVHDPAKITGSAPAVEYKLHIHHAGRARVIVQALPTHEITEKHKLVAAIAIDGGAPVVIAFAQGNDEHDAQWRQNVLRNYMEGVADMDFTEGPHTLTLYGMDPSVAVDRILLDFGGLKPSNFGPHSTRYDIISTDLVDY